MIERLLEADRLLALGLHDQAERIYWQAAELDPRNAIAVVGLARVALEKRDDRTALEFGRKALEIDPESPAAQRLVARLEEVMAYRGEAVPEPRAPEAGPTAAAEPAPAPSPAAAEPAPAPSPAAAEPAPAPSTAAAPTPALAPTPPARPAAGARRPARPAAVPKRPGLLRRLFGGR
jgi:tetratricopeptide (TPR) repeat protein